jgi:hypothetical protein
VIKFQHNEAQVP